MTVTIITYENLNDNSIAELELPTAVENLLRRNSVATVGDLIERIEEDTLEKLKGLGAEKTHIIKNALFNYELCNASDPIQYLLKCGKVA